MNVSPLIEAADLKSHLADPEILIIDLSSEENYLKGHIPGAVHLPSSRLMSGLAPIPNRCPTDEQLQNLCDEIGLTPETWVIAYDDQKGPWAGRLMWTLNIAGHHRCSVLNGQLSAWTSTGLTTETRSNAFTAGSYPCTIDRDLIADVDYITSHLNCDDHLIWDARSFAEYSGEKIINAKKGGHIPGAKHFEWTDCLISDEDLRIKPAEKLREELEHAGITADKTVITHCQTHRRSGLTYLIARHLGFNDIRCYDGSWFEWGNLENTPVEK